MFKTSRRGRVRIYLIRSHQEGFVYISLNLSKKREKVSKNVSPGSPGKCEISHLFGKKICMLGYCVKENQFGIIIYIFLTNKLLYYLLKKFHIDSIYKFLVHFQISC